LLLVAKHPYLPEVLRRRVLDLPWLQRAVWGIEALGVVSLWGLLRLVSPDRAVRIVRAIASRLGPRMRTSKNIRDNLAIMFPDQSPEQHAALERQMWGEHGALFADYAHIDRICGDGSQERIEIVAPDWLLTHVRSGRPAVYVTAHLSSFHISTWAGTRLGGRATALYTPDSNPILDRLIQRRRDAIAADLVPREGGIRVLLRELAKGGSVGLAVDGRHDQGDMVPFFGIETPTVTTPARLALRFGCPLVPVRVERIADGARFRITFYEAVKPSDPTRSTGEQALDMTRQLNEQIERWIRERPGQWMIVKRRWPRHAQRPALQTRVEPLPARASEA
jgi:KDO2-lipid IV(A) lauroyltransferase